MSGFEAVKQPAAYEWDEMLDQVLKEEYEKKIKELPRAIENVMIKILDQSVDGSFYLKNSDWIVDELCENNTASKLFAITRFYLQKEIEWDHVKAKVYLKAAIMLKELMHID